MHLLSCLCMCVSVSMFRALNRRPPARQAAIADGIPLSLSNGKLRTQASESDRAAQVSLQGAACAGFGAFKQMQPRRAGGSLTTPNLARRSRYRTFLQRIIEEVRCLAAPNLPTRLKSGQNTDYSRVGRATFAELDCLHRRHRRPIRFDLPRDAPPS